MILGAITILEPLCPNAVTPFYHMFFPLKYTATKKKDNYSFPGTFDELVSRVQAFLRPGLSRNGKSLRPNERVMVFVVYLATNSVFWFKKFSYGISKSTVWNCIHECIDAFMETFVADNIQLPNRIQALQEAQLFHDMSGFPKICWSALDGSHIALKPPREAREDYRNRYFLSKNLSQLSCLALLGCRLLLLLLFFPSALFSVARLFLLIQITVFFGLLQSFGFTVEYFLYIFFLLITKLSMFS